jgi:hypothetical protein
MNLLVDQAMQLPEFDIIKTSSDVTKSRRLPRSNRIRLALPSDLRMLDLHSEHYNFYLHQRRAPYYHHEQQRRIFKRITKKDL